MKSENVKKELRKHANKEKAKILSGFFKTGKGQYGEGDMFIGVTVPEQRAVARKYKGISLAEIIKLLKSKVHEERLTSLLILVQKFKDVEKLNKEKEKEKIADFYLKNAKKINNWDLVDLSADKILGEYLYKKSKKEKEIIYRLAKSNNLWEKRISVLITFAFIRRNEFEDSLKIFKILLYDSHDLIQKAVGWMLREIGNRNLAVEEKFLKKYHKIMPRTMLRYSIEKFSENKRRFYMKK